MIPILFRSLPLAILLGVAACPNTQPYSYYDRPGAWKPTDANDANLRAMIANPGDLAQGAAADGSRGNAASRPVKRLLTDTVRPLPSNSASGIYGVCSQQSSGSSDASTQ
jgi:hypothetical protein